MIDKLIIRVLLTATTLALASCGKAELTPAVATPPPLAEELIFFDWADDSIATVFDDFTEEYGVEISYVTFDSTEEAVAQMNQGQVFDIVVMENQFVSSLVAQNLLAEIDYSNVPNIKNISANFRDLSYDPKNKHTIPYTWGTTGLVVRADLVEGTVSRWADMWDTRYAGQNINWDSTPRYTLGATLKMLGYSANSEDPDELEEALAQLLVLKPNSIWLTDEHSSAPLLVSGGAVMALGWSEDVWLAQEESDDIAFILPEEGAILWGDNFVIPANSPHKHTAELFLNFVLRPEITARIVSENYYPMPNDAAMALIDEELRNDPVVFPTNEQMKNAELLVPLSPKGEQLYADIWERFMAAD